MRLLSIAFEPFGALSGVGLDFGEAPGALHVIWGPNEAGKSTALRGILGFLFEIDHQSKDRHDAGIELRVRARLAADDGRVLDLVRRKGRKHTLRDGVTDEPVPERTLTSLLGGIDKSTFTQLYALDHLRLREGAESILAGEGRLGELLLEASTGSTGLAERLSALRAEADALYAPKRRTTDLHKAIDAYREATREMGQASLSHTSWTEQQRGIADSKKQVAEAEASLRDLREEATRLERTAAMAQPLRRLRKKRARRAELGQVADVPEGSAALRDELAREAVEASAEAERGESELPRLTAELATAKDRAQVITGEIDRAHARRLYAEIERLRRALAEAFAERDGGARALGEAAWTLGPPPSGSRWEDLAPDAGTVARIQALGARRDAAEAAVFEARRAHEEALAHVVSPPCAPAEIDRALDLDRALGEGRRAVAAARALDELADREIALVAKLAVAVAATSARDLDALDALALPDLASLDEESRRRAARAAAHNVAARDLAGATVRKHDAQASLDAITTASDLPSEEQLVGARASRDKTLREARTLVARDETTEGATKLDELAERTRAADAIADRLRTEAARVEQAAALTAEVRAAAKSVLALQTELEAATGQEREAQRDFAVRFPALVHLGLEVAREHVLHRAEARVVQAELDALRRRQLTLQAEVRAATASLGLEANDPANVTWADLEGALAAAEARRQRLGAEEHARESAAAEARASRERAAATERELARARSSREDRRAAFAAAIEPFGLGTGATLEEARALLDALALLGVARRRQGSLGQRLSTIEADLAAAEASFREAMARAGLEALGPEEALARADAALDARAEIPRIEAALASKVETARAARDRAARAGAKLSALSLRTGVAGEGLAAAEDRAREARGLDRDIAGEERLILEQSTATSLGAAEEQLRDVDFDATEDRLERLRADIEALEARRDRDLRAQHNAEFGLTELGKDSHAADFAQAAQSYLQRARDLARRAAVARTAVALLEREVERYRTERAGPALGRAGALFAALTADRWSGLRAEDRDDGSTEIRGVRDGRSYGVEALSEGTRDQLYLALRLAALEHHAQTGTSLPLVLDDVLVNFDDQRTEAAIRTLGEIAKSVQVLLFSHEQRVAEIARRVLPAGAVALHELARTP